MFSFGLSILKVHCDLLTLSSFVTLNTYQDPVVLKFASPSVEIVIYFGVNFSFQFFSSRNSCSLWPVLHKWLEQSAGDWETNIQEKSKFHEYSLENRCLTSFSTPMPAADYCTFDLCTWTHMRQGSSLLICSGLQYTTSQTSASSRSFQPRFFSLHVLKKSAGP